MNKMLDTKELNTLFSKYGYIVKEQTESYHVYLLNQGMYHGAEVVLFDDFDPTSVLERYSKLGYSTKRQCFANVNEAEEYLFRGFFNTATTAFDISRRYNEFANNQVKQYNDKNIRYEYINMPYVVYKESSDEAIDGDKNIIGSIISEIEKPGAHLIVVEAAAGFGKTCTAYELYKYYSHYNDSIKPIFTELSRNRDAKRFKYVLWDEIEQEKETTVKQDVVVYNIKKGRIPLIIDGFDELLSKNIDYGSDGQLSEFEQVETMLSTIGDLLDGSAKVILTSRKTAIFAGTEFMDWVEKHNDAFDVVRFQLEKPNIKDWLSNERFDAISSQNVPIDRISNPVLLTYLRNIDDEGFYEMLKRPDSITDKYFENLLNREKVRQNLAIRWEDQMVIFENLAKSFADFDITGDSRSFVKELIVDYNRSKLLFYRELMPTKQSLEELADTLTNHALLDRQGNKDFISFVNEFVFGYLLAKAILKEPNSYLNQVNPYPDYLLELAVSAYKYSPVEEREKLWERLSRSKSRMSLELSIMSDCLLMGKIYGEYRLKGINSYTFDEIHFLHDDSLFADVSFVDSTFIDCYFEHDVFSNVTFTGCVFKNCRVNEGSPVNTNHQIHCYGCEDFNTGFIEAFEGGNHIENANAETHQDYIMLLLGKYFKVDGKTPKMKYVSTIRKELDGDNINDIFEVFDNLRKDGLILVSGNNSYISKKGISYYHKNF